MKKTLFLSAILGAALCGSAVGDTLNYTVEEGATKTQTAVTLTSGESDITVLGNLEVQNRITLNDGANLTIASSGEKTTFSGDNAYNFVLENGSSLTLTTAEGASSATYDISGRSTGIAVRAGAALTLTDNVTLKTKKVYYSSGNNGSITMGKSASLQVTNDANCTTLQMGASSTLSAGSLSSTQGITMDASASMTVTGNVDVSADSTLSNVTAARITFSGNSHVSLSGTNTLSGMLDLSNGDGFSGDIRVKRGGTLTQNGTLWMRSTSKGILLEKGAGYTHGILTITGLSEDENNLGQLVSTNSDTYDIAKTNFQLKNVAVTIKNPGNHDTELQNKLVNASLTYTNTTANKTLKLYGSGNTLTGISMGNGATLSIASGSTSLGGDASLNSLAVASGAAFSITGGTTTLSSGATLDIMSAVNVGTGATLSLSNSTLKLENMVHSAFEYGELQTSGITSRQATYTLVSGDGSVTRTGNQTATTYGASVGSLTWAEDNKSFTASETLYRVLTGEANKASISDVNAAVSQQGAAFIQVDGTLTGLKAPSNGTSAIPSVNVIGSGTVQVDGEFQYHNKNFLENFTGTVEILSGETHIGNQNNGAKFTNVSAIKLTGGAFKGWSTTFARNILLSGGTLSAAGNNMTYSGRVTVDADSTIEGNGGTTTLSGFVDAKTGLITIKGAVTHSAGLDMSGDGNKYTSNMLIKTGATFTSSSNLWVSSNNYNHTTLTLEQNGKFIKDGYTLTGLENGGTFVAAATQNLAMNGNHTLTNVNSVYSGAAGTNSNNLAGTTTLKNTGANLLTFNGTIGENAILEGVLGGEDGETSNVKYTANYGEHQGTIKNVNVENLDAGAYYGSITMDGVYGSLKLGGTQRAITLKGNGLHLTAAGAAVENKNSYAFAQLSGTGNLEKRFAEEQNITIETATGWTGTYANTSGVGTVIFNGNTGASMEGGSVVLKGTNYSGDHISDAAVTTNTASEVTINNKLTNVALTANNDVTLTAEANTLNSFSGSGALALSAGSSLTVKAGATTITDLTLGAGSTIALGAADNHDYNLTTNTLTVAGNSTINANLVVNAHGTLDFSSGATLTMGCTVEIGDEVTVIVGSEVLEYIQRGEAMTIMYGVDNDTLASITLGNVHFVMNSTERPDFFFVTEKDTANGGWKLMVAPEPATATLSLLALAALAARRRRH